MTADLSIRSLLHIVGFLYCATTQQTIRNGVILIAQDRTILHHVGVFFSFQQHIVVSNHDNGFNHVCVVFSLRILREQLDNIFVFRQVLQVFTRNKAIVGQQFDLLILIHLNFLCCFQIFVRCNHANIYLAVHTRLNSSHNLVDRDEFLDCHAHTVINRCAVGVKQEVLGIDWHDLDRNTVTFHHTNSSLPLLIRDWLSGGDVLLLSFDHNLTNTSTVDFSHQFDLVDSFANLVFLKILHELIFDLFNIEWITVYILNIVFNVKEVTLSKDGFHDFGMASFYSLLGSGGNNAATFRFTSFVVISPLTTKDTFIFFPV